MRLHSMLAVGVFATASALSFLVRATEPNLVPGADVQADKKAEPHSHVEENGVCSAGWSAEAKITEM